MKVTMVGTGYVGLVTGACFADMGNSVTCLDVDASKIATLKRGESPIYEPGLSEMIQRNAYAHRLHFTTDKWEAYRDARIIFICVGTPSSDDGSADLKYVLRVAEDIADAIERVGSGGEPKTVVVKSTVPVGTSHKVRDAIRARTKVPFHIADNPEFLKEGDAINDFLKPDRVVCGVDDPKTGELMRTLYDPFVRQGNPIFVMDVRSAEMVKYASNAMLACKISFINEIANLCERTGADINSVREGMCSDKRIGNQFLYPGLGYGGSCLRGSHVVRIRDAHGESTLRLDELFCGEEDGVHALPGIEVLSWSPSDRPAAFRPTSGISRRAYSGRGVELKTSCGATIVMTADHPVVVLRRGAEPLVFPASVVCVGDLLPRVGEATGRSGGESAGQWVPCESERGSRPQSAAWNGDRADSRSGGTALLAAPETLSTAQIGSVSANFVGFGSTAVVSVRQIDLSEPVFSVEIPGAHTFVTCGGVVVHNCFPKDTQAVVSMGRELGFPCKLNAAVHEVNQDQRAHFWSKVEQELGANLSGKSLAFWGVAFKPKTDDIREAPSLTLMERAIKAGAKVRAYDPVALEHLAHEMPAVSRAEDMYSALDGAEALIICTEWAEFRAPDFAEIRKRLARPIIFDGRNLFRRTQMQEAGFTYASVGRATVRPK
jgi:UDP-glucose 6-dehydrogenase